VDVVSYFDIFIVRNGISSVMVSLLASNAVDCEF
jgi:hypothetical protein